ncbi:expressed unknown protein [Seminavis robusta]|uniref:Uncharacterized protein n=1 Tax=Seminavis robusta TaxID=568900 RepID=A0A9N8D862_9STRA|nr:expressed unknown protein [Seminavis robusta]|eukprot:Sro12_g009540.1 n/a (212) ;mRNA; r:147498-148133
MNPTTSMDSNTSETSTAFRKCVRFDDAANNTFHESSSILPNEAKDVWYTGEELKESFRSDVKEVLREYFRRVTVKEGKQDNDKNYVAKHQDEGNAPYTRGLDALSGDDKARRARCDLYRSLVLKQHATLASSMSPAHAMEMLEAFASKHSQWAKDRACDLAVDDAAEARRVYRDAFLSKEGVDQGLGIFPQSKRRPDRRNGKRKSGLARSA